MLCPDRYGLASEKSLNCDHLWNAKAITAAVARPARVRGCWAGRRPLPPAVAKLSRALSEPVYRQHDSVGEYHMYPCRYRPVNGYDTMAEGRALRVIRGAVRHSVVDAPTQEKPALATETDQADEREKHAEPK